MVDDTPKWFIFGAKTIIPFFFPIVYFYKYFSWINF